MSYNPLKQHRESLMISKSELTRKADVSALTISRIEQGLTCRVETQRKILLALGLEFSKKVKIFPDPK